MSTLPRVTHILAAVGLGQDFGAARQADLDAASARGTHVHRLAEAHHYGYLDEAEITPAVAPYWSGYLKFLADSRHEPTHSEVEVIHPTWHYCGHVDRVGYLADGLRWILDFKTGALVDLVAVGRQLAGYRLAWNAMHPATPAQHVAVVQLREDGTYRFRDDVVNDPGHEEVFLAACVVFRAQKRRAA